MSTPHYKRSGADGAIGADGRQGRRDSEGLGGAAAEDGGHDDRYSNNNNNNTDPDLEGLRPITSATATRPATVTVVSPPDTGAIRSLQQQQQQQTKSDDDDDDSKQKQAALEDQEKKKVATYDSGGSDSDSDSDSDNSDSDYDNNEARTTRHDRPLVSTSAVEAAAASAAAAAAAPSASTSASSAAPPKNKRRRRDRDVVSRKTLKKDLECPVCMQLMQSPLVLPCGHSLCEPCRRGGHTYRTLTDCPTCRRSLTDTDGAPNFTLRNLVANNYFTTCRNQGCSVRDLRRVLKADHDAVCEHKVLTCEYCPDTSFKQADAPSHAAVCDKFRADYDYELAQREQKKMQIELKKHEAVLRRRRDQALANRRAGLTAQAHQRRLSQHRRPFTSSSAVPAPSSSTAATTTTAPVVDSSTPAPAHAASTDLATQPVKLPAHLAQFVPSNLVTFFTRLRDRILEVRPEVANRVMELLVFRLLTRRNTARQFLDAVKMILGGAPEPEDLERKLEHSLNIFFQRKSDARAAGSVPESTAPVAPSSSNHELLRMLC